MFDAARADADTRAERVRALRERIGGMERLRSERALPVSAPLAGLLPGGLATGGSCVVEGSTSLALELLREPSRTGHWCGIVGMPDLGIEAAATSGVDLDRLALVPHPGEHWLAVVSALVDAVSVVLVRPPAGVRVGEVAASRLAARLRRAGAALVVTGEWPRAQVRLSVGENEWIGIGAGHGRIAARRATVVAVSAGRARSRQLWLPDAAGGIRLAEPAAAAEPLRALG